MRGHKQAGATCFVQSAINNEAGKALPIGKANVGGGIVEIVTIGSYPNNPRD
jgi:hypothetical protein